MTNLAPTFDQVLAALADAELAFAPTTTSAIARRLRKEWEPVAIAFAKLRDLGLVHHVNRADADDSVGYHLTAAGWQRSGRALPLFRQFDGVEKQESFIVVQGVGVPATPVRKKTVDP